MTCRTWLPANHARPKISISHANHLRQGGAWWPSAKTNARIFGLRSTTALPEGTKRIDGTTRHFDQTTAHDCFKSKPFDETAARKVFYPKQPAFETTRETLPAKSFAGGSTCDAAGATRLDFETRRVAAGLKPDAAGTTRKAIAIAQIDFNQNPFDERFFPEATASGCS